MRGLKLKPRPTEDQKEKAKANKPFTNEEKKIKYPMVKENVSPKKVHTTVDKTNYRVLPVEQKKADVAKPPVVKTSVAVVAKPKPTPKVVVKKEVAVKLAPSKPREFMVVKDKYGRKSTVLKNKIG